MVAISGPVSATTFRPLDDLVSEADARLLEVEGYSLEKLAGQLYEERSRKRIGDFPLSERIHGYWDRAGIEIDLVAVAETEKRLRFGSCKRDPDRLVSDIGNFKQHVQRYLELEPLTTAQWKIDYVGIAPLLQSEHRHALERSGVIPQDLNDLTYGLRS